MRRVCFAVLAVALASCSGGDNEIPGHARLVSQVERQPVGSSQDQRIEMVNSTGEWERTGLIFGYADDYAECLRAIEGLRLANPGRQYRCDQAN